MAFMVGGLIRLGGRNDIGAMQMEDVTLVYRVNVISPPTERHLG